MNKLNTIVKKMKQPVLKIKKNNTPVLMPKYKILFILFSLAVFFSLAISIALLVAQLHNHITAEKTHAALQSTKIILDKNDAQLAQQFLTISELQTKIQKLETSNKQKNDLFFLLKSYYFLQTAKLSLTTTKDPAMAIKLLSSAEENLVRTENPAITKIRNALNQDLKSLQSVAANYNIIKITSQLEDIQQKLSSTSSLSQPKIELKENLPPSSATNKFALPFWNSLWQNSLAILKKALIIREQQQPLSLLNTDQRTTLLVSLQYKIAIAEWALLHNQDEIYLNNLKQVADTLRSYQLQVIPTELTFMLKELQELQKISPSSMLPNLETSEKLLETAITQ